MYVLLFAFLNRLNNVRLYFGCKVLFALECVFWTQPSINTVGTGYDVSVNADDVTSRCAKIMMPFPPPATAS